MLEPDSIPSRYPLAMRALALLLPLGLWACTSGPGPVVENDLRPAWDTERVLENPHKGWYHHYFDNSLEKYGAALAPDDFLEDFPGLDHIYLRLAWSFLEPEEGRYDWDVVDREIERWTAHGYGIAFRMTCRETNRKIPFATPEWVKAAGAKGTMVPVRGGGGETWEPDYGDPVFLEKLAAFHRALAARYDGQPWLAYVDVGSYGDWGEGHTVFGSNRDWPVEVIKEHIDIHVRSYPKSLLVISDDFMGNRADPESREVLLDYVVAQGLTLRDDSVSVKYFADNFGPSTLRNPEYFERFWRRKPVVLEHEHYHTTKEQGVYREGRPLELATEEAHATYVGFHGDARTWLAENPELARRLANRMGYWYFPARVWAPETMATGTAAPIRIEWLNRGVAPAYHRYPLSLGLSTPGGDMVHEQAVESDNRAWMPDEPVVEAYALDVPAGLPSGTYHLVAGLTFESEDARRPIELGLSQDRRIDGRYRLSEITLD